MAPDAGALQSRVAQLEEELATVVAQVLEEGHGHRLFGCRAVLPSACMDPLLQHTKPYPCLCCAGRGGSHRRRAGLAGGRVCRGGHCARCLLLCMSPEVHQRFYWQLREQRTTRPPLPPPRRHRCPPLLQANEQRFRLLEGKHTALVAEKDKLFQENETLRQVSRRTDLARSSQGRPKCRYQESARRRPPTSAAMCTAGADGGAHGVQPGADIADVPGCRAGAQEC